MNYSNEHNKSSMKKDNQSVTWGRKNSNSNPSNIHSKIGAQIQK